MIRGHGLRHLLPCVLLAFGLAGSAPASVVVEFPGPVPVGFPSAVNAGVGVPVPGSGDRLLIGLGVGNLALIDYSEASGAFATVDLQ
ncbi:MAG TPA: hypothetical protein PLQ13_13780, partial [Candidatus Krumholzibacteria bacterium]|nr:hypothetical protein [Candidatus Krumholzibacteria bacterium]